MVYNLYFYSFYKDKMSNSHFRSCSVKIAACPQIHLLKEKKKVSANIPIQKKKLLYYSKKKEESFCITPAQKENWKKAGRRFAQIFLLKKKAGKKAF